MEGITLEEVYASIRSNVELLVGLDAAEGKRAPSAAAIAAQQAAASGMSNYYEFLDDEDEINGEKILLGEIEKFRMRQRQRDKEREEQRIQQIKSKLQDLKDGKLVLPTKSAEAPKESPVGRERERDRERDREGRDNTAADEEGNNRRKRANPSLPLTEEDLEAKRRRKLQVIRLHMYHLCRIPIQRCICCIIHLFDSYPLLSTSFCWHAS